ncbi:hypothetical protein LCGC14_0164810 [marine sediment metagenome]|uniref:Uncharacterized protein n=1 Tax=marine sediment metagenome TaxID=412755 RepID=A0A0F9VAR5_9ZZZZ
MADTPRFTASFRPGQRASQHLFVPFPGSHQGLVKPFSGQQVILYPSPPFDVPPRQATHNIDPIRNGSIYALVLGVFKEGNFQYVRLLRQDLSEISIGAGNSKLRPISFPYAKDDRVTAHARSAGGREPGTITAENADGTFQVLLDSGTSQAFSTQDILILDSIPAAVPQVQSRWNV